MLDSDNIAPIVVVTNLDLIELNTSNDAVLIQTHTFCLCIFMYSDSHTHTRVT